MIFRGNAEVANRTLPFSQFDSKNPEKLREYLAGVEMMGAQVLAIPHNGNLSNGRMFTVEAFDGQPLTRELAAMRIRFEPLIEATQIKGDGETHPLLSPNDEFADYEKWDKSNLNGTEAKKSEMIQWEYAREALKTGLKLERQLGVNPYKFGASSPSRTAGSTWSSRRRIRSSRSRGGSRPRALRGGLGDGEHARGDLRRHEAQGNLCNHRLGKSPTFLVAATKDPEGGNLDRIQIVKGWLDKDGTTSEKVYDVVWSGDRKPGANGKLPPVGNSVDVARATWTNTIGSAELVSVWTDPAFDASQPAFYYSRVPTPRWTACEALRFGVEMTPNVPMTTQERAYTSPIWYAP